MSTIEWTVTIGGLTAIAWVNWYFFLTPVVAENQPQKNAKHHPESIR